MSAAVATPPAPTGGTPAPVPTPTAGPSAALLARLKRFTVAEYHDWGRRGLLTEKDRVVLIEGYLVNKPVKNPPHETTVNRLRKRLDRLLPAGWDSRIQASVTLADSEPEPDYAVVRGSDADYAGRHPGPADIGLVVEVADSSLAADRTDAQRMYAAAGIAVYWIVNIPDRQVEVYTDPDPAAAPPAYRTRTDYRPGDAVPVSLDGVPVGSVAVADVLP
jgi:Uma2 family endonuclease